VSDLLTPLDVVNQTFRKGFRGYDPAEVDEFLDQVAESLQNHVQRVKDLERSLQQSEEQLKEFRELKESMQEALILAQRSAEDRVRSAQAQAEAIVAEARLVAERLAREGTDRSDETKREILRLRQVRNQYVAEFRGLLSKFDSLLSNTFPGGGEEGFPPMLSVPSPGDASAIPPSLRPDRPLPLPNEEAREAQEIRD
jgi:cell division initiation protein